MLDLSQTTWHELPHPDVVSTVTFAARGALHTAPDPTADDLRRAIGRRHGVEPDRVAVGHGAAQLLSSAAQALLEPGDELITPWPSYGLYPLMAQRARARAVPVTGGHDVEVLRAAVTPATRMIVICNPNDPTGAYLPATALRSLLDGLPEQVTVLLDEALADFVTAEPQGATLPLLDDHPRLLIFRTFSKAYGLAGLRCRLRARRARLRVAAGAHRAAARRRADLAQLGALEALHSLRAASRRTPRPRRRRARPPARPHPRPAGRRGTERVECDLAADARQDRQRAGGTAAACRHPR